MESAGQRSCVVLLFLLASLVSSETVSQHQSNQIQTNLPLSLPPPPPPSLDPEVVSLNNDFDWKLVKEVFQREQQNTIFSPFSVKLLLTLLYEAAGENSTTKRELSKALVGVNLDKSRELYREFLESSTKENGNYEFNIGTRVYVDDGVANVTANYTELVEWCYKTNIERVDFGKTSETVARVNDWCSNITHGHLNELVTEDHIKNSVMVIANVLFLKASWRNSFDENNTRKREFHVSPNHSTKSEFMEQTDIYAYLDDSELQLEMVRLPYKGRLFSMYIVLPYANRTLDQMVSTLTADNLIKLEGKLLREEVVVVIPKFKFDYGATLNDALTTLGISEVFTNRASLPQLSGGLNETLQVSKILQKAGIEVNEKGTLAFAATEIQLVNKFGIDDNPIEFIAERPFMFYIKDEESDALLFVGKVQDPMVAPGTHGSTRNAI